MTSKLIIAMDFDNLPAALTLADALDPTRCALKVGSEMFTRFGREFVNQLINKEFKVFLDLKFHDIPNTVAAACKACADLGVWMLNVHALGGLAMMQAAQRALETYKQDAPLLIAVTVLTSCNEATLAQIGMQQGIANTVTRLALLAKTSGLSGVVCSAWEAKAIKESCGNAFITVTPGIRQTNDLTDDQSRTMTPRAALQQGSDYLVIGRPITLSSDPMATVAEILKEMHGKLD